jgi:diketogulonate reductase-like aldo/keto reductase
MVNQSNNQVFTLLNNAVRMPMLGLGVYSMYGKEAEHAIQTALETGYRLIDTAAMYHNEREVGNAIKNSGLPRTEIFITSKVNNPDQGYDSTIKAFKKSLSDLRTDYIDLYLVHWPVRGKRRETWKALEKIYMDGQVRAIGVANYLIPFLEELQTYAEIIPAVNQVEFSPYLFLKELYQSCKKQNIQLHAYSPLVRDKKLADQRLVGLARKYGKTPAQIILRWDIELGVSPIPKSVNPLRLKENFNVFDFCLTKEDVAFIGSFNENLRLVDDPMVFL